MINKGNEFKEFKGVLTAQAKKLEENIQNKNKKYHINIRTGKNIRELREAFKDLVDELSKLQIINN